MNKDILLERIPVTYGPSAVRVLFFENREKKHSFRRHWHERLEILRVYEGEMTVNLGTKAVLIKKDEMVIIPPRTIHAAEMVENTRYCAVMFDLRTFYNATEIGERFLTAMFNGNVAVQNTTGDKNSIAALDSLTLRTKTEEENFCIMANVYNLIAVLFAQGICTVTGQTSADKTMREIIDYMEENFTEEISTASLCKQFGYTVPYFCKRFKNYTGLTPMNYLKIYRMEKAYSIMKKYDLKISEIAERCGFNDANYFTRCFTAHFGNPPTYYMKQ